MTITVIDLGMGNVGSVANMLRKVGGASVLTSDPDVVSTADRIVLPGVGAFDTAMERLDSSRLTEVMHQRVLVDRIPVLGICLGMQLFADGSEEGALPGLGWIPGRVHRLPAIGDDGTTVKVPHMGWSRLSPTGEMQLDGSLTPESRFYFVHSYAYDPEDPADVLATTNYGSGPFCAIVGRDNLLGVQFHPEKSHRHGMNFLRSFVQATA